MNKLLITLITLVLLNSCSFNENSKIWKNKEIELNKDKNIKKVFAEDKRLVSEFNQNLELDLSKIKINNIFINNQNNFGAQSYNGKLNHFFQNNHHRQFLQACSATI